MNDKTALVKRIRKAGYVVTINSRGHYDISTKEGKWLMRMSAKNSRHHTLRAVLSDIRKAGIII